jgi:uncharacterized protein YbjT (DUF2867 family)
MAVLVLGGYGLVGSAIVERLRADGLDVIGLGRRVTAARRRWPDVVWREADLARLSIPEAWVPLLADVEVVVNAAGVLQQGLSDDPTAVQERALLALIAAAPGAGIRRIVQISAVGAQASASTAFLRTKAVADTALLASGVPSVILRPGVVIAQRAYGGTAMLRALAAFPMISPLVHADAPLQTVGLDEVAEAVSAAVRGEIASGAVIDLVEAEPRSLADTVRAFRAWLGQPPARLVRAPAVVAGLAGPVADALGWLGWRSPLRSTAISVMREGVIGDPASLSAWRDRPLRTLPETLARLTAGPQELWFARLWLLKAPILATLAVFWAASGTIGLWRDEAAIAVLTTRGAAADFAAAAVWSGGAIDLTLGLAVLVRPWAATALKGMILVSLSYLAGGTLLAPDLWLDPLGPLVKVVPAILLALVGLAVLEER